MGTWETNCKRYKANMDYQVALDADAKAKGILKGRYIQEQCCDSYAMYEIVTEYKTKVKIRVVKDIGDDWEIPYWGAEATIDKAYAVSSIEYRDRMDELFASK